MAGDMKITWAVYLIGLLLFSCEGKMLLSDEKNNLFQTDIDFAKASRETNAAEAFRKYIAPDCMMFPEGDLPVQGAGEIYRRMKKGADNYVLAWIPQRAEVSASGDMGWTWGTYTLETNDRAGDKIKSYGKYVNVWKKQTDGTWKVIVDIGNASPPTGQ